MAQILDSLTNGGLPNLVNLITAVGALGGAAMGLVDTTKLFGGGPSNFGFGYIEQALSPFLSALASSSTPYGKHAILRTLRADWLNGVAKDDQKAKAKSLIQLSLSQIDATALANVAAVDPAALQSAVQKKASSQAAAPEEASALGQFEAVLGAVIDTAYERGDQEYRNASKFLAMLTSVALGAAGGSIVFYPIGHGDLLFCVLAGLIATPVAPVAKDLASALQTAVAAASALKK
ncbi:hypothetical protein [Mesorhizobium loti]|uniref:Uncharacterized protein n=1 Tax=Mesorhizobium loti R88b TaxID=935548 RepID=A0A6M7WQD3_RHILI|nr:hypothetical protein [Mesorhizobium loti]QKD01271.1 hypothetical protein EB235_06945 [Mesorhizobium loti R88b]